MFPCDRCVERDKTCYVMPDDTEGACAECTRRDRPCIINSWTALDRVGDELAEKISADEKELHELLGEVEEVRHRLEQSRRAQEDNNEKARIKYDDLLFGSGDADESFQPEGMAGMEMGQGSVATGSDTSSPLDAWVQDILSSGTAQSNDVEASGSGTGNVCRCPSESMGEQMLTCLSCQTHQNQWT